MVKSCFGRASGRYFSSPTSDSPGLDPRVTLNTAQAATDPGSSPGKAIVGGIALLSKTPSGRAEGGMVGGRKQADQAGLRYW